MKKFKGMTKLASSIEKKIPKECQVKQCKRKGCSVSLKGFDPRRLIINMDCKQLGICSSREICDYIVIGALSETEWLVPLELKRGNVEADKVRSQIQEGTKYAEEKLRIGDAGVQFRPVVVFDGKVHRSQTQKLKEKQYRVKFRNKDFEIVLLRSGKQLVEALNKR